MRLQRLEYLPCVEGMAGFGVVPVLTQEEAALVQECMEDAHRIVWTENWRANPPPARSKKGRSAQADAAKRKT